MKRALVAIGRGVKMVRAHHRMWLALWFINLVVALVAIVPAYSWLKSGAGYSLALAQSPGRFDFTFLTDLLRSHGGIAVLLIQFVIIAILYWMIHLLLAGGILNTYLYSGPVEKTGTFVQAGLNYFWRIFRLALLVLLMHLVLLLLLFLAARGAGIDPMEMESDLVQLRIFGILFSVYLILAFVLMIAHIYTRIIVVRDEKESVIAAFKAAMRFLVKNPVSTCTSYLIILLILAASLAAYYFLRKMVPTGSAGVLLVFVLAQGFLFVRIGIKLLAYTAGAALMDQNGREAVSPSG